MASFLAIHPARPAQARLHLHARPILLHQLLSFVRLSLVDELCHSLLEHFHRTHNGLARRIPFLDRFHLLDCFHDSPHRLHEVFVDSRLALLPLVLVVERLGRVLNRQTNVTQIHAPLFDRFFVMRQAFGLWGPPEQL